MGETREKTTIMVTVSLAPEYGYVVMVGTTMVFVNVWKMMRIGGMRKKLGIKYPIMYSEKHPIFNCYQRAHQNTLESFPILTFVILRDCFLHFQTYSNTERYDLFELEILQYSDKPFVRLQYNSLYHHTMLQPKIL